jgi:hypothetical protein
MNSYGAESARRAALSLARMLSHMSDTFMWESLEKNRLKGFQRLTGMCPKYLCPKY